MKKQPKTFSETVMHESKYIDLECKPNRTILDNMELILHGLEEFNGYNLAFLTCYEEFIEPIKLTYKISDIQAVIFSICIRNSKKRHFDVERIAEEMQWNQIELLRYYCEIEELHKKHLLRFADREEEYLRVPKEALNAVRKNVGLQQKSYKKLNIEQFFRELKIAVEQLRESEIFDWEAKEIFELLISNNPHLSIVEKISSEKIENDNARLFLFLCSELVSNDNEEISMREINNAIPDLCTVVEKSFRKQKHTFFEKKWVEASSKGSFLDPTPRYKLTNLAIEEFLSGIYETEEEEYRPKSLIVNDKIVKKELFYNSNENEQVETLTQLMMPEKLKEVLQRMEKRQLRTGFTCLFYGAPGTGKTETVLQLAKQTGRDIYRVEISETKNCYFGESEKLIKKVFDNYRKMVENCKTTPILLFNEADAIFSKRKDISSSNVAQTENAIQNIILQELENLNGILIATTNLTDNLDAAFERRFLFKIKFEKPCLEAKAKIWKERLSWLNENEAASLAQKHSLSGGEIENIIRKIELETILKGIEPSVEMVEKHCLQEKLLQNNFSNPIGFKKLQ